MTKTFFPESNELLIRHYEGLQAQCSSDVNYYCQQVSKAVKHVKTFR